jgi:hypothetical protein
MNGHAAMSLLHFKKRHSARKLALRSPTATPSKAFPPDLAAAPPAAFSSPAMFVAMNTNVL